MSEKGSVAMAIAWKRMWGVMVACAVLGVALLGRPSFGQEEVVAESEGKVVHFSAAEIKKLRHQAAEVGQLPKGTPEGWSKSRVDPAKVVSAFPGLKLREGFVLRAYVFKEDGNSNGFVWGLPKDAAYPEPKDCPRLESHFLNPPKPLDAVDDLMEAIDGDDTAASYLHASLFKREIREFGGGWHGIQWGMASILDQSPWKGAIKADAEPFEKPRSKLRDWKWAAEQPKDWRPEVKMERDQVVVSFYVYTALAGVGEKQEMERERILHYVDTYKRGKYRSLSQVKKLATGPDAIAH